MRLIRLSPADFADAVSASIRYCLYRDDAYEYYVAASKHDLTLISFDPNFGRTEQGGKFLVRCCRL